MKHIPALAAALACLFIPSVASADTGTVTNVFTTGPEVSATYTASGSSCSPSGYCGYYPYGVEVPASVGCYPYNPDIEDGGRLTFVGEVADQFQSQTGTDTFYPDSDPVRICLYLRGSNRADVLVAEYVHNVTTPTQSPGPVTTTPPSPVGGDQGTAVPPMTVAEARSYLRKILRKRYGSRFNASFSRSCYRFSREKVRCFVSWKRKPYRYAGHVTVWNNPDDPETYLYRVSVKRKRLARSSAVSLAAEAADLRAEMGLIGKFPRGTGQVRAVLAHSCTGGRRHAVIGGVHKCLARGQFCARSRDREYHRSGFHCHNRDARGNYHLS